MLKISFLKILSVLSIIFIISGNIYTICADDVDNEEENNEEIVREVIENEVSQVAKNIQSEPVTNSRRCIIYDRTSKTILYGKNENTKCAMASTTKIMTAIVVLEHTNLNDEVIVSAKAGATGGSRLGLKKRR